MNKPSFKLNKLFASMFIVGGLSVAMTPTVFAEEAEDETDAEDSENVVQIVGFRGSLSKALNEKRNALNGKDAIVAEDMGKFPDLNIAESIQRIAGVAISREGGEGRQITVRGLGPAFTRATLNGMEVPSSTDGLDSSGGFNSTRAFDFNVFASELFNQVDIQKTPTASVEEGGIAATIDLYTGRPFDNPGLHFSVAGQMGYNDLTEENDPRLSAIFSNTFLDDKFGVLFSIASTERTVRQEGYGTVRWTTAERNGRTWADTTSTVVNGTPTPDSSCVSADALNCLWHPRLPRTDYFGNDQDRLGMTGSIQFQPTDNLVFTLDLVQSKLENYRESLNYFEMFRNSQDGITPLSVTVDPTGQYMQAGTFSGVFARSESRLTVSETDFSQAVISASWDVTPNITIDTMFGQAESDFRVEQYRFNMTTIDSHTFGFDFTDNANVSTLEYGYNHMDPAAFVFSGPTIRANDALRENDTFRLDLTWELSEGVLKTGLISNTRSVETLESNISDRTTPASTAGLTRSVPVSNYGTGLGAPSNYPSDFLVVDFNSTIAAYALGAWEPDLNDGSTWEVEEKTLGVYVEYDSEVDLGGMNLRYNVGVRAVQTDATMGGAVADPVNGDFNWVTIDNDYNDILPTANFVLEAADDVQIRLNLARTMTRPSLGSLTPTASLSGINGQLSGGNPNLDPFRANAIDLGVEWYFDDEALLAATYFYKDIKSFIARASEEKLLDPVYRDQVLADPSYDAATWVDPTTELYDHSIPLNNDGASLKGFELIYQQPFSALPAPFNNFGTVLNFTYVDSETVYGDNDFNSPLEGLSKNSSNITIYYETETYGARISSNKRDDYITDATGSNGNQGHGTSGGTHFDLSAFYNVTENLTISFEGLNLTDENERLFTTGDGTLNLVREYNHTGRQYFLGARYNF